MDAKVAFYWRHSTQIEKWAALRRSAVDLLVTELSAQLDRLRESIVDDDIEVIGSSDLPLVAVTRPSWTTRGIELQVGLSWDRSALLAATGMNMPWVGVRIGVDDARRRDLFGAVGERARAELRQLSWIKATRNWPGWTYLDYEGSPDITTFARACGNEVIEGWQLLAPRLDQVVAQVTRTSGPDQPDVVLPLD